MVRVVVVGAVFVVVGVGVTASVEVRVSRRVAVRGRGGVRLVEYDAVATEMVREGASERDCDAVAEAVGDTESVCDRDEVSDLVAVVLIVAVGALDVDDEADSPVALSDGDCEGELDADIVNDMVSVSSFVAVMLCVAEMEYVPVVDTV
jgi:urease gamma subunit